MLNWLIFGIPWPVQITIFVVLALAVLYAIGRIFGWGVARQIALPVLGVIGALGLLSRSGQQGYAARKDEEQAAEQKANQVADQAHINAQAMTNDQLAKETDRWSRN